MSTRLHPFCRVRSYGRPPQLLARSPPSHLVPRRCSFCSCFGYGLCNTASYTTGSPFGSNLNSVLTTLMRRASSRLYSNATISNVTNPDANVYGMFQCRGDLTLDACSQCVSSIVSERACGSAIGERIQKEGCFLRYENTNFFGPDITLVTENCNASNNTHDSYERNLGSVINTIIKATPEDAAFYNASSAGNSTAGPDTVYGQAQCLGYLSKTDCARCLSQASDYKNQCGNSISGQIFYVDCYYRYQNSPFLTTTTGPAAQPRSPAPGPAPAPQESAIGTPRSPATPPTTTANAQDSSSHGHPKIPIIVGTTVGASLAILAVGTFAFFWRRKKPTKTTARTETGVEYSGLDQGFQRVTVQFTIVELRQATRNFHPENKLGEGGFGPVYKGTLTNGRVVAVKVLASGSNQGKREFFNEVNLITNVQHRNLIELLGCCVEESERLLVYEYLPKKSLDILLFGDGLTLDWRHRYEIIIGITRGLAYLHEDSQVRIIHRDIKTSNILLDDNLNAKISDFGLARLFANDQTHITTGVAGTLGYLAPEYAMNGQLTEKVDVFSFGLVALEIVSGRRIIDHQQAPEKQRLLELAWRLYEQQQQLEIVDPRLGHAYAAEEVIRVVHVALLCTQTVAGLRPAMSQVLLFLCGQSEILAIPTKPTIISMDANDGGTMNASSSSTSAGTQPSRDQSPYNPASLARHSISAIEAR